MPIMDGPFDAVLFDWRGTLVTTPTYAEWVGEAMRRIGRPAQDDAVEKLAAFIADAEARLDGPGVDCDADLHRRTYLTTFAELGIEPGLAEALYAVESDPSVNVFAADAAGSLGRLHRAGLRIAVISDIHIDIRAVLRRERAGRARRRLHAVVRAGRAEARPADVHPHPRRPGCRRPSRAHGR